MHITLYSNGKQKKDQEGQRLGLNNNHSGKKLCSSSLSRSSLTQRTNAQGSEVFCHVPSRPVPPVGIEKFTKHSFYLYIKHQAL